jgi:hypothetical protein
VCRPATPTRSRPFTHPLIKRGGPGRFAIRQSWPTRRLSSSVVPLIGKKAPRGMTFDLRPGAIPHHWRRRHLSGQVGQVVGRGSGSRTPSAWRFARPGQIRRSRPRRMTLPPRVSRERFRPAHTLRHVRIHVQPVVRTAFGCSVFWVEATRCFCFAACYFAVLGRWGWR